MNLFGEQIKRLKWTEWTGQISEWIWMNLFGEQIQNEQIQNVSSHLTESKNVKWWRTE